MAVTAVAQCPVCGSRATRRHFDVVTTTAYTARRCRDCGLVFTWPRPTPEELAAFYSGAYFTGRDGRVGYEDYAHLGELNARRSWSDLKRYGPLDGLEPRHVLDVGCATGGFLAEAKRDGWRCTGVEMAADAVESAQGQGLDVRQGDIFEPSLEPGGYGLITMWHVLEHLIEPAAALARARELVAPAGRLFIELPNWDSMGRVAKRAQWSQMKPPEHINFFTRRSLGGALRRAGFTPLQSDTHYPSLWDRARLPGRSRPLHLGVALVGSVVSAAGRGGYLRVLARP